MSALTKQQALGNVRANTSYKREILFKKQNFPYTVKSKTVTGSPYTSLFFVYCVLQGFNALPILYIFFLKCQLI